jgi:hypothetical protein
MRPVAAMCTVCLDPGYIYDVTEVAPRPDVDPLLGQLVLCERCRDCIATGWVMVQPWPSAVNA